MKTSLCVVKITLGSVTSYHHMEEVVYYRSGMTADFLSRWDWYFCYLAALVKVRYPKRKVELFKGPQDVVLGDEWHEQRRVSLLKHRKGKLKKLENGVVEDDLFGFNREDNEMKIRKVKDEISALERDEYPIPDVPEYINRIKDVCKND